MFATIRFAAATAILAATGLAATAHAAPLEETRSTHVRYADLDLASANGVTALHRRIGAAVNAVCGTVDGRDLAERQRVFTCRAKAIASARPAAELAIAGARGGTQLASTDQASSIRLAAH